MKGYYDITTTLKAALLEDVNVNTVTEGTVNDIDISKQTIFPLSHLRVDNVSQEGHTLRFSISVELVDIVDINNVQTNNRFLGNDNEHDILNTQLAVGVRLIERFRRGDLFNEEYALGNDANYEPLINEYENGLSGWKLTFDVLYRNEMTIC